jgi:transposase
MKPLVSDDLWAAVAPLLPPRKPRPKGGRKPLDDREVLSGILFVLKSGIPWRMLPQELGFASGVSCWRRLGEWQAAGVWDQRHAEMLRRLHEAGRIDWSRARLDSASVPAKKGAMRRARARWTEASWAPSVIV